MKLFYFFCEFFFFHFVGPVLLNSMNHIKYTTGCQFRWMLEWRAVCICFSSIITKQLCVLLLYAFVWNFSVIVWAFVPLWMTVYSLSLSLCEKSHNWWENFLISLFVFALILFNSNWNLNTHRRSKLSSSSSVSLFSLRFVFLAVSINNNWLIQANRFI